MPVCDILSAASGASGPAIYIDDVFSTYLYTGNNTSQNINNGIDLAGKGGLVWCKNRTTGTTNNILTATPGKVLFSNLTNAEATSTRIDTFNSNGFFINNSSTDINQSANNYASWTFRKQPKFFDVVTYTGDGVAGRTVAHNLGSVPGMIIVKPTSAVGSWVVYSRGAGGGVNPETYNLVLNTTAAQNGSSTFWNSTAPTSSVFSLGSSTTVNNSGTTYVAYLFAHNAGGFGATGTDNVISCGSFTTDGGGNISTTNIGFEPQFVLIKRLTGAGGDWRIYDSMRGMPNATTANILVPNTNAAEAETSILYPTATGFSGVVTVSSTFIYMAIRRPMKPPTSGTQVFSPVTVVSSSPQIVTTNFPVDLMIGSYRSNVGSDRQVIDRLRGATASNAYYLNTNTTNPENSFPGMSFDSNTSITDYGFLIGASSVYWNFRRASGFFDEVCYTGTGLAGLTITHNLGVAPELMFVKARNLTQGWSIYCAPIGNGNRLVLETNAAQQGGSYWNNSTPTATSFQLTGGLSVNGSGYTYVAYLFATLAGVSKVGSYTGTGATQTINCGFTGGARFVLIKRTNSTGDWYVWDTARGMVSGTDPSLLLNSTAIEVNANSIYTATTGFQIVSTAAGINASGGSYIFLAIA